MPAFLPTVEIEPPYPVPRLLVELPSRPRVFFSNLGALISRGQPSSLHPDCAPGEFWLDVFVQRKVPWRRFLESAVYHVIACGLLIAFTRLLALQPRVVAKPTFEHSQVIYYNASEYLPPLDTRDPSPGQPAKDDPEFSPQEIISVPQEADNRTQTIVTPPKIKLNHDVTLPNMVAWADEKRPMLAIPDVPVTPAAEIRRMPQMENSVVSPPPDAARVNQQRNPLELQNSVVAPPPPFQSNALAGHQGLQPALIVPPPNVQSAAARSLGEIDFAPSAVIAPAPQLPVAAQRTTPAGNIGAAGSPVVPPPPSVSRTGSSSALGSPGRVIALNLHPALAAPPGSPAGNRRGTFAANPRGHAGASGSPGSADSRTEHGANTPAPASQKNDLPSGLYVGKTAQTAAMIAADAEKGSSGSSVNPNLIANARPPRLSNTTPHAAESAAKLSHAEQAVFAGRKFYSLTLNMPNLNSAGGSWIIRFAEKNSATANPGESSQTSNLSQPIATKKVDPAYPLQLMQENVAGTVILYAVIRADGSVGDVRVLRGVDERLDRFAAEAVAQWNFQPATKDGLPIDVEATFQIPFRPARVGTNF